MTISEGMVLQKALRGRISELMSMRNANAVASRRFDYFNDGKEKERTEIEPKYDPKVVDAKITEIEIFLYKLDAAIKQANALTDIALTANIEELPAPIK